AAQWTGDGAPGSAEPEAATLVQPEGQPVRLGDYRIVREIGRGGMGVVYEAVQLSLGRLVALKILSFAAALDPRHLRRFQLEAQAVAQLQHPHIVPVYAVGSERGAHYYAMQLIEGRTLACLIAQMRGASRDSTSDDRPERGPAYWRTVACLG